MQGTIITFGRRAATIQIESGQQFYAPCAQMSLFVIHELLTNGPHLPVTFAVDDTRTAGVASGMLRYYAQNVELKDILIL
tara:strand:+ start:184 stop:423 length:240 start_codon:yes stop_codon:yes gene_type:complete